MRTPFSSPQARVAAGTLGMRLFLLSLGVLFGATLIGYISIRLMAIHEPLAAPPPPKLPPHGAVTVPVDAPLASPSRPLPVHIGPVVTLAEMRAWGKIV